MTIYSAVTIAMHRWMSYKIWWPIPKLNTLMFLLISVFVTLWYQSIHLKYPVSHIPEDCHIYLQNGKLILRLCESPDQGTAEVHSSDTHPTKYRKLSSTPTKCTTSITESSNSITICEKDKSLWKVHFHTDFHMAHFYINSLRNVFVLYLEANTFHLNEN